MPLDPCLNDPEYRARMRFVEEMLRGEVPEVRKLGVKTLSVDVDTPIERLSAIETALSNAGLELYPLRRSHVWVWEKGPEWHNPCRGPFNNEPIV